MSDNDYDSNEPIGEFCFERREEKTLIGKSLADDEDDDGGYDPYDDPFQDDNNNNCTTTMIDNDPEHFEYRVTEFPEMQKRLEATAFPSSSSSSSYAQSSSTLATCSICWKSQNQFESVNCQHTFCCDCWSQYIETNFRTSRTIRKSPTIIR